MRKTLNRVLPQVARQHKPVVRRDHRAMHMRRILPSPVRPHHTASRVIVAVEEPRAAEPTPAPEPERRKASAAIIRHERIIPRRVHRHVARPIASAAHPLQRRQRSAARIQPKAAQRPIPRWVFIHRIKNRKPRMHRQKARMRRRSSDFDPTQLAALSIPRSAKNALVRPRPQQNPPRIARVSDSPAPAAQTETQPPTQ